MIYHISVDNTYYLGGFMKEKSERPKIYAKAFIKTIPKLEWVDHYDYANE